MYVGSAVFCLHRTGRCSLQPRLFVLDSTRAQLKLLVLSGPPSWGCLSNRRLSWHAPLRPVALIRTSYWRWMRGEWASLPACRCHARAPPNTRRALKHLFLRIHLCSSCREAHQLLDLLCAPGRERGRGGRDTAREQGELPSRARAAPVGRERLGRHRRGYVSVSRYARVRGRPEERDMHGC